MMHLLDSLGQGFSNFFSEGQDETPEQPERARTFFFFFFFLGGGGKNMSLAAGVQGPLKGPGSSGVIDAF